MHPIEKVHKLIIAGNVIGPNGTWIPRSEAVRMKRIFLSHLVNGEVEIRGGVWAKLSSQLYEQKAPAAEQELPAWEKKIAATVKAKQQSSPYTPMQNKPAIPLLQSSLQKKGGTPSTTQQPIAVARKAERLDDFIPSFEDYDKETIKIRTFPLGKETILAMSEMRVGHALVANCSLRGFLDQTNADEFHTQLLSMLDFGVRYFVLDFEHTTQVGSAGWGVLAVTARLIKSASGKLMVCCMKAGVEESFNLLQFDEVIEARGTLADCLTVIEQSVKNSSATDSFGEERSSFLFQEDFGELPLPEKIKTIITRNGAISLFRLRKILQEERFGTVKINPFRLYILLKELNLESKWKRLRFYRSC